MDMRDFQTVQHNRQYLRRLNTLVRLDPANIHSTSDILHIPAALDEYTRAFPPTEADIRRLAPPFQVDLQSHFTTPDTLPVIIRADSLPTLSLFPTGRETSV